MLSGTKWVCQISVKSQKYFKQILSKANDIVMCNCIGLKILSRNMIDISFHQNISMTAKTHIWLTIMMKVMKL